LVIARDLNPVDQCHNQLLLFLARDFRQNFRQHADQRLNTVELFARFS